MTFMLKPSTHLQGKKPEEYVYQNINGSLLWVLPCGMIFIFKVLYRLGIFHILSSTQGLRLKSETTLFLKGSRDFITFPRMV